VKYKTIKPYVVSIGVLGTIYKEYTSEPLSDLGLDFYKKAMTLRIKLSEH